MESSTSFSVVDSRLRIGPIEGDDELLEANMDLLRVHVCLIMAGTLTMRESKPVPRNAFSALRRFHGDAWLCHTGRRIGKLLKQRERIMSRDLAAEATLRVTQERLAGQR